MKIPRFPKINFFSVSILFILFCSFSKQEKLESQPNVIYIISDQFRQFSLGFWSEGNNSKYIQGKPDPVNTPNLNILANNGVVFSRSVSNFPLCSPHRGMLMSGMYPDKNGATNNCRTDRPVGLKQDVRCITDVFASANYEVSYFGKTHWLMPSPHFDAQKTYVGTSQNPGGLFINQYDTYIPPGPDRHHIKYMFQLIKDEHYNPMCYSNDPVLVNGKKDGELFLPKRFSTEIESEAIVGYLENTRNQREQDKPFFMIWSINPPHNPWDEKSTNMKFFDQYGKKQTGDLLLRENADKKVGDYAPYYFANVSAVDYYIGTVIAKLKELKLDKNTIIVFSADHGEMLGSHGKTGKNVPEIESYAIPFIVNWGSHLQHRVENLLLSVPDIMPTILGMAGLKDLIPTEVQGKDYSSLLLYPTKSKVLKPTSALFINSNSRGVYTGDYTFVVEEKNNTFAEAYLYDNNKDPYQLVKVTAAQMNKEQLKKMKKDLIKLLKETNDSWYQNDICMNFLEM